MKDILWVLATLVILVFYSVFVEPVFGQTFRKEIRSYCLYEAGSAKKFAQIRDAGIPRKELEDFIIRLADSNKFSKENTRYLVLLATLVYSNSGLPPNLIYKTIYKGCVADLSRQKI